MCVRDCGAREQLGGGETAEFEPTCQSFEKAVQRIVEKTRPSEADP